MENIYPDLDQNFTLPTMNSGIMNVYHNDPENIIGYPEDFLQYRSWLLSGHKGNTLQKNTTKVITEQLDGGSNYRMFTNTKIFAYIRPVKCNV